MRAGRIADTLRSGLGRRILIIMIITLSLRLIGKSLAPITRLKLLAQRFAAGDLKSRIRLHTGDEFQALGNVALWGRIRLLTYLSGRPDLQQGPTNDMTIS